MYLKRPYSYDYYKYVIYIRKECLERFNDVINMLTDEKYIDFSINDLQLIIKELKDLKMFDMYLMENRFNYLKDLEKEKENKGDNEK